MKCPLCAPGRNPEWPTLRQSGIEDWLKCPICKGLIYSDGRQIKVENHHPILDATRKDREEKEKSSDNPTTKKK